MYGDAPDEQVAWYSSSDPNSRNWVHQDERGSVIGLSDASGAAVLKNRYDEYGNPQSGNAGRFGYTGQAWLPEIGLHYYKNRMYKPGIGFMQTDPIGYAGGANLYAYVLNDPINLTDPLGLIECEAGSICITAGASGFAGSGTSGSGSWGFDVGANREPPVRAVLLPTPPLANPACPPGACKTAIVIKGRRAGSTRWFWNGTRYVQDPAWRDPWYDKPVTYGFAATALAPIALIGGVESGAVTWEGESVGYANYGKGMKWQVRLFRDFIKLRRDINKPINHYNFEVGSWKIHIPW